MATPDECGYDADPDFKPGYWDLDDPASFANGVLCMEIDVDIECTGGCPEGQVGCRTPKDNDADLMICVDVSKVFPGAEWEDCLKALADVKTLNDVRKAAGDKCEDLFNAINPDEDDYDPKRDADYKALRLESLIKAVKETGWCECTPVATHSRNLRPDTLSVITTNHKEDLQKRFLSKI